VFPAVMTQLGADLSVDAAATATHLERLLEAGCRGLIMLGSLGENTSLSPIEKVQVLETAVASAAGRVPVLSGIAEYTTAQAVAQAEAAAAAGCAGLMVLPAMVYKSDARETLAHFRAVAAATELPIMIYNNPPAYGVDVTPEMFVELAEAPTIAAIKESSEDPRRLVDIANLTGDRYVLFCGVDDVLLESVLLGAVGWVAGLVNAFPEEGVALFELAAAGRWAEARRIGAWFMPLLHLDTKPKLVQYLKLTMQLTGLGSERVRPPRLPLIGDERAMVERLVQHAIATRPELPDYPSA
jgi:4-hydroxy-tetrahydrodipicolinate synthase